MWCLQETIQRCSALLQMGANDEASPAHAQLERHMQLLMKVRESRQGCGRTCSCCATAPGQFAFNGLGARAVRSQRW